MSDGTAVPPGMEGVGEIEPLSSKPPTTGSACTTAVAVGDVSVCEDDWESVGEINRSGWREDNCPRFVLVLESFMLPPSTPPCCFRSRLENCLLSTEHQTFSPLSKLIQ
uniref:Uncharacterized protein n=1 Tax=Anopheles atroparvus TaxID=41427 RepID=A0A182IJ39_ANOAO